MSGSVLPDSSEQVTLSVDEARGLGLRALGRVGLSDVDARLIVDHLIDAGLCGYGFASLPRILAVAAEFKRQPPAGPVRVVRETPVSAVLDGNHNCGYIAVYRATEVAIRKAKAAGFALVGTFNTFYSGRNGYYLDMVTRQGLVGIHLAGCAPWVAPLGGAGRVLGTNPFAVGVPTDTGSFVFDIGTSAFMRGELDLAARLGQPIPEGVAVDAEGLPTTDARRVLDAGALLPFGGHKGYGLALAVQALGMLAASHETGDAPSYYGYLHVVIDPELVAPRAEYQRQVSELLRRVKEAPRQVGVQEIRIPGERAARERERRRREGLQFDKAVIAALEAL